MWHNLKLWSLSSVTASLSYKRVFNGVPSIERGKENAALLREALVKAGKTFDRQSYTGAGYDSYFSPEHHSEIWIPAAWWKQTSPTDPTELHII